jgi:hypothetical protein
VPETQNAAPTRRRLATGAAWTVPAVVVATAAPAYAASKCTQAGWTGNTWDMVFRHHWTCTSTNCQLTLQVCNVNTCGKGTAIPIGTQFTVSLKNNAATSDSIQKASGGSGYYSILAGSTGPGDGTTATLAAGGTWNYTVRLTSAIAAGGCIQFAWNNLNPKASFTLSASLSGSTDGDWSNSSACTKTFVVNSSSNLGMALC